MFYPVTLQPIHTVLDAPQYVLYLMLLDTYCTWCSSIRTVLDAPRYVLCLMLLSEKCCHVPVTKYFTVCCLVNRKWCGIFMGLPPVQSQVSVKTQFVVEKKKKKSVINPVLLVPVRIWHGDWSSVTCTGAYLTRGLDDIVNNNLGIHSHFKIQKNRPNFPRPRKYRRLFSEPK